MCTRFILLLLLLLLLHLQLQRPNPNHSRIISLTTANPSVAPTCLSLEPKLLRLIFLYIFSSHVFFFFPQFLSSFHSLFSCNFRSLLLLISERWYSSIVCYSVGLCLPRLSRSTRRVKDVFLEFAVISQTSTGREPRPASKWCCRSRCTSESLFPSLSWLFRVRCYVCSIRVLPSNDILAFWLTFTDCAHAHTHFVILFSSPDTLARMCVPYKSEKHRFVSSLLLQRTRDIRVCMRACIWYANV